MSKELYDIVIIGAGPAGLSAGLYTSRANLSTLILDSAAVLGQVEMTDEIENYPGFDHISGFEMLDSFKTQAEKFGCVIKDMQIETVGQEMQDGIKVFVLKSADEEVMARSVIVATGNTPRMLGVPGEKEFRGKGVSYCATCDGPFFRNKKLIVMGGGDTAVEEACFLTKFAEKVTVIHRRDKLRATKIIQDRAFANDKIDFIWDSKLNEIKGDAKVAGVDVENIKTGEKTTLDCDGVFIFVGSTPNTQFLKDGVVELDESGYIKTDMKMRTSLDGLYVAGDCRSESYKQIVIACGDGAVAALSAQHYVESQKGEAYE